MGAMGSQAMFPVKALAGSLAIQEETRVGLENAQELNRAGHLERANADIINQQGALQAGLLRQRGSQFVSAAVVGQATGNLDTTSGSPADVQQQSRIYADLDAETARNNARRAAMGQKEVARRYDREAERVRLQYQDPNGFMGYGSRNGMQTLGLLTSLMGDVGSAGMGGGGKQGGQGEGY